MIIMTKTLYCITVKSFFHFLFTVMKRKHVLACLLAAAAVSIPSTVSAQSSESSFRIGLGTALSFTIPNDDNSPVYYNSIVPELLLPIDVADYFRLEPVFGIAQGTSKSESANSSGTQTRTESVMRLGLGLIYKKMLNSSFQMNIGVRPSALFFSNKQEEGSGQSTSTSTLSNTAINIAGTFGGEYFFAKQFSMGVEAHINYLNQGETSREPADPNASKQTYSAIYSSTFLTARLYF